ncbi:atg18 [Candida margitis]|uniref:atg18 n=1 Tax=Candida margitis TaxID=1775924 RepID=UPI0022265DAA|nr:atg18 [Candida margitis]KAI5961742.1 atg18 [Candida margitis]
MTKINNISFNPDFSLVSIATSTANKIFNCEPFGELYSSSETQLRRTLSNSIDSSDTASDTNAAAAAAGSISGNCPTKLLKMLFSTSLTIIVPEANYNRYLKVFNLKQNLKIVDLEFESSIVDVKLNRKRLIVALQNGELHIYDLSCIKLLSVLRLSPNVDTFVGDLSIDDKSWLCIPVISIIDEDLFVKPRRDSNVSTSSKDLNNTQQPHQHTCLGEYIELTPKVKQTNSALTNSDVTLQDIQDDGEGWLMIYDAMNLAPVLIFKAHDSAIGQISISHRGNKIATASVKGTIVRVFELSIAEGGKVSLNSVKNLRRGHNVAKINSLCFNNNETILGCGSESNTIHFFKLVQEESSNETGINNDTYETDHGNSFSDYDDQSDGENHRSSSEDLNESLANLLVSKALNSSSNEQEESGNKARKSWFSKTKSKFIHNPYTTSFLNKIPYRDYLDNLIWEPPRRSFAYIKLPEHAWSSNNNSNHNKVAIGFNGGLILIGSYQTGKFYHYQLPKQYTGNFSAVKANGEEKDKREECLLVSQYDLLQSS